MKKIFIALAAVAAMVGCSKENNPQGVETKSESIAINASIDIDATRVTVEGEMYTDVKWEQGDMVALASEAGMSTTLSATEAGDKVCFVGEGVYAADVDTYYAIYPTTTIDGGVATIDLANQSGDDAAVLVAKTEGVAKGSIDMSFKPANALLHVAVSGASELVKAEFKAFDGSAIASTFTYNFAEESASASGEVAAYTIESPAASFFFSLPADLDMANGYIVSLTDAAGNVCSKAYNGKTFAKGTTTRVDIAWSTPSVTLGAKTSYSYYLAGDSTSANKCANTDIYFVTGVNGESCASSYSNVQDAMISDLGYEVSGVTYSYSAGEVSWDKASNTFCMNSQPSYSTSWGEKSDIKAFVVVDDIKYYSTNSLYITGLPYSFQFYNSSDSAVDSAGWKRNGGATIKEKLMSIKEGGLAGSDSGWIASPGYYAPASISTMATIQAKYYVAGLRPSNSKATLYVGTTTSNTASSSTAASLQLTGSNNTSSDQVWSTVSTDISVPAGVQYISINHNGATYYLGSRIYLCNFELKYK